MCSASCSAIQLFLAAGEILNTQFASLLLSASKLTDGTTGELLGVAVPVGTGELAGNTTTGGLFF